MNNDSNNLNNNVSPETNNVVNSNPAPAVPAAEPAAPAAPVSEPVAPAAAEPVQAPNPAPVAPAPAVEPAAPAAPVSEPVAPAAAEPVQAPSPAPVAPTPAVETPPAASASEPVAPAVVQPEPSTTATISINGETVGSTDSKAGNNGEEDKSKKKVNVKNIVLFGLIIILSAVFVYVLMGKKKASTPAKTKTTSTLVENVTVSGHACSTINDATKCEVTLSDSVTYTIGISNTDLLTSLDEYEEYVKLNVYYIKDGNEKKIVDYKLFMKDTNEDITSVSTVDELRTRLGMFSLGTHTETLTLSEIGSSGVGSDDDTSYTYTSYKFTDSNNVQYEMKYIDTDGKLDVAEGNQYSVTFEVENGSFGYEYTITSVQ